jgi:hypothetical protein
VVLRGKETLSLRLSTFSQSRQLLHI